MPQARSSASSAAIAATMRREKSIGSSAASGCSGTIRSTTPSASSSSERIRWAAASSGAWSVSRKTMALAPSGGRGASHAWVAARTRSAGRSASAPPPLPWPRRTETVGVSRVTKSARQRAISGAKPRSSASRDSAAPAVSITRTSGSFSSAARCMLRRASRNAAGPIVFSPVCPARSWPKITHGSPRNRARA